MSMREKMARAMCEHPDSFVYATPDGGPTVKSEMWKLCLPTVDRMLDELMNPTTAMKLAGRDVLYEYGPVAYLAAYNGDDNDIRREYGEEWGAVTGPFLAMIRAIKEGA